MFIKEEEQEEKIHLILSNKYDVFEMVLKVIFYYREIFWIASQRNIYLNF